MCLPPAVTTKPPAVIVSPPAVTVSALPTSTLVSKVAAPPARACPRASMHRRRPQGHQAVMVPPPAVTTKPPAVIVSPPAVTVSALPTSTLESEGCSPPTERVSELRCTDDATTGDGPPPESPPTSRNRLDRPRSDRQPGGVCSDGASASSHHKTTSGDRLATSSHRQRVADIALESKVAADRQPRACLRASMHRRRPRPPAVIVSPPQ